MKRKHIVSFMLALAMLTGVATLGSTPVVADTEKSTDTVLCSFEQWKYDFTLLRLSEFWSITRSEEHASSGQYSAKLVPGGYYENSRPYFTVPLTSAKFGFNYDLSQYTQLTAKFYNDEDHDVNLQVGIIVDKNERIMPSSYVLKPGWNSVSYAFNHSLINMYNGSLEGISKVFFMFDPCVSRNFEDSDVLYVDDITLVKAAKPIEITDIVTLDPYEICNFEKSYQQYVVNWWIYNDTVPETKIVDVRKGELPAGVVPTSGNKCLQITTHPRADGYQAYPHMIITNHVVKKAVNALTEEEKSKAYVCFDLYSEIDWHFDTGFADSTNGAQGALEISTVIFWGPGMKAGKWTTVRFALSEIDGVIPPDKGRGEGCDFTNNPDSIIMMWPDYFEGENRTFYLDNVRLEIGK